MLYRSELVWLAHQLDQQEHSPDIPSVWKAIRETDLAKSVPLAAEKRQVYLTGEPEVVYSMTDLFDSLPDEKQIHIVTEEQHTHPALNWMSITYYPPHELKQLPDGENVTLFTTAKLPLWSRTYFSKNRISQVVSAEEIMTLHRFSGVRQTNIVEFSYADLLDDTRVILDERSKRPGHQLFPEIPKQFSFKLSQLHEELNWDQELDEVAAHMLNTYWLQNRPPFPDWMPILLREIQQFLRLKQNQHGRTNILEQLEEWGLRDKRID